MNLKAFRDDNPDCMLAFMFRQGRDVIVPLKPRVIERWPMPAGELHHVVGRTKKGREDDVRNLLHLSHYLHAWVTQYPLAGRVASCWALNEARRLDFAFLSSLDGPNWPAIFEFDCYREQCASFPRVEAARRRFVGGAKQGAEQ